jgi:hypothetical protein
MASRNKLFVLQFKIEGHGSSQDLDTLIDISEELDAVLRQKYSGAYVDGHDIGCGTMNIFAFFPSWKNGEEFLMLYLRHHDWSSQVVVAERGSGTKYKVIWPTDYVGTFAVL